MPAVPLPEPKYLDREVDADWQDAVGGRNWFIRSPKIDRFLLDLVAVAIAGRQDVARCVKLQLVAMSNAIEHICDTEIQSVDAATFYSISTHPEWRKAAREFFKKNKVTREEVLKKRPGANIVMAILDAWLALNEPAMAVQ